MTGRMERQFRFALEADKEKRIGRQTYLSNGAEKENDAEHAWHAALMAILLGEYSNEKIDLLKTVTMLLIHDMVEIDAGDTYAYDDNAKQTQREREEKAADRLVSLLPEDFRDDYSTILKQNGKDDDKLHVFVKAADRYSALIKCIEEMRMGNDEFRMAKETIQKSIDDMKLPEAEVFEREFLPSFYLALDELN